MARSQPKLASGRKGSTSRRVAIYTRTSSKKSEVRLTTSKARQIESCVRALKATVSSKQDAKCILKVSEVKSGRLPLAKRPAFQELISGKSGAMKVFVESARAVARDAGRLAQRVGRSGSGVLELRNSGPPAL